MNAIEVSELTKIYSNRVKAVDNISFNVEDGEVFGLLGPNGAGKSTTIKIIMTLSSATKGIVKVGGVDVSKDPQAVRQMLGYVPQAISVDADLSAYENLLIFSKLSYVPKKEREEKIHAALDYMGLSDRADDLVKHFSGGMMRRLEIAQALVNRPRVLILDEPSIGLDPTSKRQMWNYIVELNKKFLTTILITTHDMDEADILCDRIAIVNSGKVAAMGTPKELKRSVGGEILNVGLSSIPAEGIDLPSDIGRVISSYLTTIKILTENGERAIPRVIDYFDKNSLGVESISLNKPTLDDVFVKYAKSTIQEKEQGVVGQVRNVRRTYSRHSR